MGPNMVKIRLNSIVIRILKVCDITKWGLSDFDMVNDLFYNSCEKQIKDTS